MIRGTTPTLTFNLPFETSVVKSAYITIRSKEVEVEKETKDCILNGTTITTKLTQEDTLKLPESKLAKVQLRILTNDGEALATSVYEIRVGELLKEGVIS